MMDAMLRKVWIRGWQAGVREYAWWKDGEQQVGSCGTTLKKALQDGPDYIPNKLAALEDDGWVKCSERLPKVSGRDIEVKAIACQRGWDIETITVDKLTHWRNLPPPPEDKE